MTDAARYKTIATIAVAFSLGTITTAACGGGPLAAANTARLERDVDALKCVIDFLAEESSSGFGGGGADSIYRQEVVAAREDCGL